MAAAMRGHLIEDADDEPLLEDVLCEGRSEGDGATNKAGLKRRHVRSRPNRVSETLYGETEGETDFQGQSLDVKKMHTKQSKRLPNWVWIIISKSLGVHAPGSRTPWFGTLMYICTLVLAILFAASFIWYTIYDILNIYTKQTVLTGMMAIMMCIYWCSLGIYGNSMAARLFSSPKFVESVRLHSKTIFKVSAVGIMILLVITITVVNNYSSSHTFADNHCRNISVNPACCKIMFVSRVGFSTFSAVWNLLVGTVLLSVCRTHTIGIRRFIRELELDSKLYESFYRRNMARQRTVDTDSGTDDDFLWDDNDISPLTPDYTFPGVYPSGPPPLTPARSNPNSQPTTPTRRQILQRSNSQRSSLRGSPPKTINSAPNLAQQPSNPAQCTPQGMVPQASGSSSTLPEEQLDFEDGQNFSTQFQFPPPGGSTELESLVGAPSGGRNGNQRQKNGNQPQKPIIIVKADSMCIQEEEGGEEEGEGGGGGALGGGGLQVQGDPVSQCSNASQQDSPQNSLRVQLNSPRKIPSSITGLENDQESADNFSLGARGFSNEDILQRYWQISVRLRSTSLALQRWLVAWVAFILIWAVSFLVYWVSHSATLLGIADFFLPILLLPLITAAYGEVNHEGKRTLRCICPTEERLNMLYYLLQAPLEMTAFGMNISYSVIVTALGALGLAFCSKIMLDELNLK